jgi:hypothetical protein
VVLGGGALIVRQLDGGAALTLRSLREAVLNLAAQRPAALTGVAAVVIVLGAEILGRPLKVVARIAAVQAAHQHELPLRTARTFARRARGRQRLSVLVATAGVELYLLTGLLVPLALDRVADWQEVLTVGGVALGCLGLGALGLGALAVEGPPREDSTRTALGTYLANGFEILASAALNLGSGLLEFVAFAVVAWLTWFTTCESLSWMGGGRVQWLRWGLDWQLAPAAEGGLYQAASWIAGFWFLLVGGLTLMYPLSFVLRWGTVCYLLARQRTADIPPDYIELEEEERTALEEVKKQRGATRRAAKKLAEKLRERRQEGDSGTPKD